MVGGHFAVEGKVCGMYATTHFIDRVTAFRDVKTVVYQNR